MFNTKRMIILIFFSLFMACSPLKAKVAPHANKSSKATKTNSQIASITAWEIVGAIAAKNKSKGWSATLHWLQRGPQAYQIRLMGPLGNGSVMISKQGNLVYFQSGHKKSMSKNAEELLLKQTGIRLPVGNLYYWIRGLPAPGQVKSAFYDQSKHLQILRQNGYQINFYQYNSINGRALPTLIRLQGNDLRVKVVIKRWALKA